MRLIRIRWLEEIRHIHPIAKSNEKTWICWSQVSGVETRTLEAWVFWWEDTAELNLIAAGSSSHFPKQRNSHGCGMAVTSRTWRCVSEFPKIDCQSSPLSSCFTGSSQMGWRSVSLQVHLSCASVPVIEQVMYPCCCLETTVQSLIVT